MSAPFAPFGGRLGIFADGDPASARQSDWPPCASRSLESLRSRAARDLAALDVLKKVIPWGLLSPEDNATLSRFFMELGNP